MTVIQATLIAAVFGLGLINAAADDVVAPVVTVEVIQDHEDGLYLCGEQANFAIRVLVDDVPVTEGSVTWTLSRDRALSLETGELALGAEAVTVSGTLDEPGVLNCRVKHQTEDATTYGFGGAAYEPERIEATAVVPDDFDEYWEGEKAALRTIPMDAQLEERETTLDACRLYKISLANVDGQRTYGWLGVPAGEETCPALMTFSAAGWRGISPWWVTKLASQGYLAMHIIHHNFDVETPDEVTEALAEGELKGYYHQGRERRDSYYFHHVFLGCVRALDYLTSRPEWDGEHLTVTGSSQGGGISICLAGLHEKVSALAVNVPALCDHTGRLHDQATGWPRLIPSDDDGTIAAVSGYYDAVNFARKFDGPAWVAVGLVDGTCTPTSVYSAYNCLAGEKIMLVFPRMGHAIPKAYGNDRMEWIAQRSGMQ